MKFKIEYPTEKDFVTMDQHYLEEFGIPDQSMLPAHLDNDLKIKNLENNTIVCYKKDDKPIAWSIILPTSKEAQDKFLSAAINEKQLFDESVQNPSFESLYLFSVFVLFGYRQKGLAKELINYQIKYFQDKYKTSEFSAWVFSLEGEQLIKSLRKQNSIGMDYITAIR